MKDGNTEQSKGRRWKWPTVKLAPCLNGLVVVEAKNGAEELVGQTFPWYRVWIQHVNGGSFARLLNEQCKPLKVHGKVVQSKFKGKSKIVGRLQDRAAFKWANESDDPIPFQPAEDPLFAWYIVTAFMLLSCIYISVQSILLFGPVLQSSQIIPIRVIALVMILGAQVLAVVAPYFFWNIRPRTRSFADIDLMPTGIVGTTEQGEVVTLLFAELDTVKVKKGNPTRCRMETADGQVYWMVMRTPINKFVLRAICPSKETQKEIKANTVRAMHRQGIRMLILGVVLAALSNTLINYLATAGAILPGNVRPVRRGMVGLSLFYPSFIGLMYIWMAWKHSPKGQRAFKRIKARFSRTKDKPTDNNP